MAKNNRLKDFRMRLKTEKSTERKMSTKEIWSYGLCDFGKSGGSNLISSYLKIFILTVLGIDAMAYATLEVVQVIIGYCQGPVISLLEDSTKSKWGRFRPYFIVTAPLTAALSIAFFLNPFSGSAAIPYVYIFYILYGISSGFCNTAWGGLTKCITQNGEERQKAFSIAKGLSIISTVIPSAMPILIEYAPKYFGEWFGMPESTALKIVFAVMSVIMGALGIFACLTAKNLQERIMIKHAEKPWKNIGMVFKNKNMMLRWIDKISSVFSNIASGITPFLFMYCYGNYGIQTLVWGFAGFCAWVPLLIAGKVFNKMSNKKVIYLYQLSTVAANVILMIIGFGEGIGFIIALFATRCLAAVFEYVSTVAQTAFDTDIWDHYEWKYGIRNESTTDLVGGWVGIPISIANPYIFAWVLKTIQFQEGTEGSSIVQSDFTKKWLFYLFCICGSLNALITCVPYLFIKLDKKTMEKVHKELAERKLQREDVTPAMELALEAGGTVSGEIVENVKSVTEKDEVASDTMIKDEVASDTMTKDE